MSSAARASTYDKVPQVVVANRDDEAWQGWDAVAGQVADRLEPVPARQVVVVECYHGVDQREVAARLSDACHFDRVIEAQGAYRSCESLEKDLESDLLPAEPVFGVMTRRDVSVLFDEDTLARLTAQVVAVGAERILIIGTGASLIARADVLVYADMPRREIQLRFRTGGLGNLGADNADVSFAERYKRGYFVDWRLCDRLKQRVLPGCDYVLDTHEPGQPRMATGRALFEGLTETVTRPFRVVPFFDPGPWGGQWMKEVCDLDREAVNFAWCFDCVPEENSLILRYGDICLEVPAINAVFFEPRALLGEAVHARFGKEFPIRFDFLDTMGGGNLSLQVHPLTEYIQEAFGMHYTQDESYYILDCEEDSRVYLGLKQGVDREAMFAALRRAQAGEGAFDADAYAESWPVQKHDHFLIPGGTVHASGSGTMVLEISATPYIFTFKLWDWDRLDLEGKPRPISLDHAEKVVQWDRTTNWTRDNLVNRFETVEQSATHSQERTGLHERQFIETRRHRFIGPVSHHTQGGVQVLNLAEGPEVVVESPDGRFEPFVVHYAETFIVPAAVGPYTIRPTSGIEHVTIKAYVRT